MFSSDCEKRNYNNTNHSNNDININKGKNIDNNNTQFHDGALLLQIT